LSIEVAGCGSCLAPESQPVLQYIARGDQPRDAEYGCFPLSLRNVEDLLFERDIDFCHETVRLWRAVDQEDHRLGSP